MSRWRSLADFSEAHSLIIRLQRKEAFAQVEGPDRLEYLLLKPEGYNAYCDHANLKFIFNPQAHGVTKKHTLNRLGRWALRVSSRSPVFHDISGADNVWADQLSR
uniref:Uncharacterized protein n=1 Tax=Spongospora subterranea TaxID=70186 RepID=A0A0H5R004_9EUKA|eukprot:CRZ07490.1 hypothetical protein [Spongospora subterranea]